MEFNPQFQRIGEILVHEGIVNQGQLDRCLDEQKTTKQKLGEVLIKNGFISEDDLVRVYSMQLGYSQVSEEELFQADPENHWHGAAILQDDANPPRLPARWVE